MKKRLYDFKYLLLIFKKEAQARKQDKARNCFIDDRTGKRVRQGDKNIDLGSKRA
ncbi:hypothetical protein HW276_11565 [Leptotrichia sp. oral taxon 417]|jgi:hypothetical protein|uniref:hypothetical protein n=1 Tax=Leptotrichia sp. oral taxon 417 TaxID=712365 RepID=UPI0015BABE75|nr:hypothetical protein [Leptotrichia sp. oral taxon 417]NWO28316.1 hypothetical protein [Leptotrichia sp. oral taxon 417]NWO28325.1 hypothetical protein [Leptotrichia sp. oral taxon 417]